MVMEPQQTFDTSGRGYDLPPDMREDMGGFLLQKGFQREGSLVSFSMFSLGVYVDPMNAGQLVYTYLYMDGPECQSETVVQRLCYVGYAFLSAPIVSRVRVTEQYIRVLFLSILRATFSRKSRC